MNLRQKTVDAVRILSAEAIQRANSGHPGLPRFRAHRRHAVLRFFDVQP